MAEKKRTALVLARGTNWLASIPGTIDDWKQIVKGVSPAAAAGAALTPAPRGWAMDNIAADWLYTVVMLAIIASSVISLARFAGRKNKETAKAKREAEEAANRERARAAYDEINRATYRIGDDPKWVRPDDAVKIIQVAAATLATEFMRSHPKEGARQGETVQVNRELLIRSLVTARKAESPFAPLVSRDEPDAET